MSIEARPIRTEDLEDHFQLEQDPTIEHAVELFDTMFPNDSEWIDDTAIPITTTVFMIRAGRHNPDLNHGLYHPKFHRSLVVIDRQGYKTEVELLKYRVSQGDLEDESAAAHQIRRQIDLAWDLETEQERILAGRSTIVIHEPFVVSPTDSYRFEIGRTKRPQDSIYPGAQFEYTRMRPRDDPSIIVNFTKLLIRAQLAQE